MGYNFWTDWVYFVEQRSVIAKRQIKKKKELVKRVRYLLHEARQDHATAISELKQQIITDDNPQGLIPCELEEFVNEGVVDTSKLSQILTKVEEAWEKRIDIEKKRDAKSDWRNLL